MLRARNLRASANFIPSKSFRARKIYFCNEVGFLFSFLTLSQGLNTSLTIEEFNFVSVIMDDDLL